MSLLIDTRLTVTFTVAIPNLEKVHKVSIGKRTKNHYRTKNHRYQSDTVWYQRAVKRHYSYISYF